MNRFVSALVMYFVEVLPALAIGFLLSGIVHEFVPAKWIDKNLGAKGIRPIFYATITGTLLPICCWGSLPVALTFYKKGSRLGPVLAFLVATPATSVSALAVTYRLLGLKFAVYIFFTVVLMGMIIGIIGNLFKFKPREFKEEVCPHCEEELIYCKHRKKMPEKIMSILKYAFVEMPKDIGLQLFIGLILAAIVVTFVPIGEFIKNYLSGWTGYPFSVFFGLIMYFCSTASVPFVDALINQGLNIGSGLVLLLIGPITSYGTILVLNKEFGFRILSFYVVSICALALLSGVVYQFIH